MIGFELEVVKLDTIRKPDTTRHNTKFVGYELIFNGFVSYLG